MRYHTSASLLALFAIVACGSAVGDLQHIDFGNKEALAQWTVKGDVAVDPAKSDAAHGNALRVGPEGSAIFKLHQPEGSGTVEIYVYDDGSSPANPKASHVGPRWGVTRDDGQVLAIGMLYTSYLGGSEGNTATVCDGKDWFDQLFWLGGDRAKPAWHKWTFNLSADGVIRIFRDDKPVGGEQEAGKVHMKGFNGIAIWGDTTKEKGQTIWVASPSISTGGPVTVAPVRKADPYDLKVPSNAPVAGWQGVIYTKANVPAAPKLGDLALKSSVSQYGITWTFDKPARVGKFVNGDWYVVGPVNVIEIDPKPTYGNDIAKNQLDQLDRERPEAQRVRNGFMLNPPAAMRVAYDSGVRNYFDPSLIQKLPVSMKAGDSLVSTISMPKNLALKSQLWHDIERGVDDSSPIRTAAVLTCVSAALPADAFRPAFCDRQAKLFYSHDLKREMLPNLPPTKDAPDVRQYVRFTQRPWVGTCFFGFEGPVENMPQYGRDYGRVVGLDALMLCTDLKPEQKEELLIDYVQVGIDLGGMIRNGHPGWEGFGGHGCGRKLPIVLAGVLLGDEQLANINKSFPKAHFGEDEQTAYGEGWTGAKVVFNGHRAIDEVTGIARPETGPYEHKQPETWTGAKAGGGDLMSEGYRHTATFGFVAQGLALRLLKAGKAWNHDAFLDYVDRWMYEDDTPFVKMILDKTGHNFGLDWERQGQCFDPFVTDMWRKYRAGPGMPPIDGWKQVHDERYYNNAIEKARK